METKKIVKRVTKDFSNTYTQFREFQQSPEFKPYWEKCVESIYDRDFLICVVFCNDTFGIPPVKTFLTHYRDDFIYLTGDEKARLDSYIKRSIGAFWGMVFKFALGYTEQKSVSVSMNDYFMVKTASVYSGKPKNRDIEQEGL
jgi:hypothetical protein